MNDVEDKVQELRDRYINEPQNQKEILAQVEELKCHTSIGEDKQKEKIFCDKWVRRLGSVVCNDHTYNYKGVSRKHWSVQDMQTRLLEMAHESKGKTL